VNRVSEEKDSTILLTASLTWRKNSLCVVAEGVETKELEYLNRNEITLLQGYYFGPSPISILLKSFYLNPGDR
jgi:EAL domain-containing protein (putative c-di-GMP-specific phosphodiesterase class I)